MEVFANAGIAALASMFVGVLPLGMAVVYAIWPSEQRLALVRPLSVATMFAAIASLALGGINELRYISRTGQLAFSTTIAAGLAEGLAPLFFAFGCLTIAWLCVTIGLSRHP
ncbi:MAG: hypothetical protein V7647_3016 [Acidobacteriota bacterium]